MSDSEEKDEGGNIEGNLLQEFSDDDRSEDESQSFDQEFQSSAAQPNRIFAKNYLVTGDKDSFQSSSSIPSELHPGYVGAHHNYDDTVNTSERSEGASPNTDLKEKLANEFNTNYLKTINEETECHLSSSYLSESNSISPDLIPSYNDGSKLPWSPDLNSPDYSESNGQQKMHLNLPHNGDYSMTLADNVSDNRNNYPADSPKLEFKRLYERRGEDIDNLKAQLNKCNADKENQVTELKRKVTVLQAINDQLKTSQSESRRLLADQDSQIKTLQSQKRSATEKWNETEQLLSSSKQLIATLESNLADNQSRDIIIRNQKSHQELIQKLENDHHGELRKLQNCLSKTEQSLDDEKHKFTSFEAQFNLYKCESQCNIRDKENRLLTQQEEILTLKQEKNCLLKKRPNSDNRLQVEIEQKDKQIKDLEKQISTLKSKMYSSNKSSSYESLLKENRELRENQINLNQKLSDMTESNEKYHYALKLGVYSANASVGDDSVRQLKLPQALNFDETEEAHECSANAQEVLPSGPHLEKLLQKEIQKHLFLNKQKDEKLSSVESDLTQKESEFNTLQSKYVTAMETVEMLKTELSSALSDLAKENASKHLISQLEILKINDNPDNTHIFDIEKLFAQYINIIKDYINIKSNITTELKLFNKQVESVNYGWCECMNKLFKTIQNLSSKLLSRSNEDSYNYLRNELKEFKEQINNAFEFRKNILEHQNAQIDFASLRKSILDAAEKDQQNQELICKLKFEINQRKRDNKPTDIDNRLNKKLEDQIAALEVKLSDVQSQYIDICNEKRLLEVKLDEQDNALKDRKSDVVQLEKNIKELKESSYASPHYNDSIISFLKKLANTLSSIHSMLGSTKMKHDQSIDRDDVIHCFESSRKHFKDIENKVEAIMSENGIRSSSKQDNRSSRNELGKSFVESASNGYIDDLKSIINKLEKDKSCYKNMYEEKREANEYINKLYDELLSNTEIERKKIQNSCNDLKRQKSELEVDLNKCNFQLKTAVGHKDAKLLIAEENLESVQKANSLEKNKLLRQIEILEGAKKKIHKEKEEIQRKEKCNRTILIEKYRKLYSQYNKVRDRLLKIQDPNHDLMKKFTKWLDGVRSVSLNGIQNSKTKLKNLSTSAHELDDCIKVLDILHKLLETELIIDSDIVL